MCCEANPYCNSNHLHSSTSSCFCFKLFQLSGLLAGEKPPKIVGFVWCHQRRASEHQRSKVEKCEQRTHGILGQETDLDLRVKLVRTNILRVALRSSRTGCHTCRKQLQRESIPWKQQENRHENTQKMTKMTKCFRCSFVCYNEIQALSMLFFLLKWSRKF